MPRLCVAVLGVSLILLLGAAGTMNGQQWRLQIEQRFVLDDGPSEPIKDLRDFAVGRDGRLYVLENTVKQVHVYAPTGRFTKSFSRSGSGPGEIRDANGLVAGPKGTLWVNDHGNARINIYSSDGSFLGQRQSDAHGYSYRWTGFIDSAGYLNDELFSALPPGTSIAHVLQRRRADGTVVDTVRVKICPGDSPTRKTSFRAQTKNRGGMIIQIPFVPQSVSAFSERGGVWCAAGTAYRIVRRDLRTGAVTAEAVRGIKAYPVPRARRDSAIAHIRASVARYESSDVNLSLVPNEYPYVGSLTVDDRGSLWALRPQADSTRTEFDVFDEHGTYLTSTTLAERTNHYLRVLVRGDLLYAVVLDPDDVPSIVRARIIRPPAR